MSVILFIYIIIVKFWPILLIILLAWAFFMQYCIFGKNDHDDEAKKSDSLANDMQKPDYFGSNEVRPRSEEDSSGVKEKYATYYTLFRNKNDYRRK